MNDWIDQYRAGEAKDAATKENAHRRYLVEYLPRVEHLHSQIIEYLRSIQGKLRIGWPSDFTRGLFGGELRERNLDLIYFPYVTHLETSDYLQMRLDDALIRLKEAKTHVKPICRIDTVINLALSGAKGGMRITGNGCGRRVIFKEVRKTLFIRRDVRRSDGYIWIDSSDTRDPEQIFIMFSPL